MHARKRMLSLLLSVMLSALLSACATSSPSPGAPSAEYRRPPLPGEARQPTPPNECKPSCTEGMSKLRQKLSDDLERLNAEFNSSLTKLTSPAAPASVPTTK